MIRVIDEGRQPKHLWPVDNSLHLQYLLSKSNNTKRKRKVNDFVTIYEDHFQALKSRLLQGPSQLQIIPIVGMLGLGKRTLAQRLYNDSSVADHFHARAWVTIPYEGDVQVILLNLLECLGKVITKELRRLIVDELGILICNDLRYRKYFIALHDVWDPEIIDTLRKFCPDDGHGCRILYTAFKPDDFEATTANYRGQPHVMRYLTDTESWLLFCHRVFSQDHCPDHELESIGRIIVRYCNGITQLVVGVAGVLTTSEKTLRIWELVAQALGLQLEGETDGKRIISSVSLILYNHLPYYLKPCLLYVGSFAECCDICASKIIKLWISECFVKQTADESLEDVAAAYLEILIDKNLLHLTGQDATGRIKAFQVLPFLRGIFILVAREEKFLWSKDYLCINTENEGNILRHVSGSQLLRTSNEIVLSSLARSFISSGHALEEPTPVFVRLRLLRILDVFQLELFQFPLGIVQLVLLRYLAFSCHLNIPDSISNLWNLHALVIRRIPSFRAFSLTSVLLEMAQLIHIKCKETFVWHHPENETKHLNEKLETLTNMQLFGVNSEFFEQVPNIRKLGIVCNIAMDNVLDLACLHKLETLKCSTDNSLASKSFLCYIKFPSSLRKLTLNLCKIPCGFMKVVGALSTLEELKVQNSDFLAVDSRPTEPEWELEEGEFRQLISLMMKDLNLVHWKARASHFPRLKQLVILNCYAMIGIPLDIGDIETLELTHMNKHSPSVVASVMQIKEKHAGSGNQLLQVEIIKS